ncbi:hypothetical protein [Vibrio sp. TBV020]|uniref:hypothetical protein n=1 Tax=Vibrio sp. TBV020 TaxID=3137398 RepID=UPI0038CDBC8E
MSVYPYVIWGMVGCFSIIESLKGLFLLYVFRLDKQGWVSLATEEGSFGALAKGRKVSNLAVEEKSEQGGDRQGIEF